MMPKMKTALFFALIICFHLVITEVNIVEAAATIDCRGKCEYRCSKASRQKMCIRACNTCCERCNCVPPGTSGNTNVCPCYANMKTHNGRLKCP
ncbi:Gibberellin-regulated family protein [Euphorbia peplus]|nr:Gibberellin-regulated family protein [Euphorbia peplus]